jgi:hypothetical protein
MDMQSEGHTNTNTETNTDTYLKIPPAIYREITVIN